MMVVGRGSGGTAAAYRAAHWWGRVGTKFCVGSVLLCQGLVLQNCGAGGGAAWKTSGLRGGSRGEGWVGLAG